MHLFQVTAVPSALPRLHFTLKVELLAWPGSTRSGSQKGHRFAWSRNVQGKVTFPMISGVCSNSRFLAPSNGKDKSLNCHSSGLRVFLAPAFLFLIEYPGKSSWRARCAPRQRGPVRRAEQMSGLRRGRRGCPMPAPSPGSQHTLGLLLYLWKCEAIADHL